MRTADIRSRFLDHFANRGHTVVPSAPLPTPDPTLLFVNAGMVPFKPYFIGEVAPGWERATSVQKCVRALDIEEVGKTTWHGSFFQMNGTGLPAANTHDSQALKPMLSHFRMGHESHAAE